MIPEQKPEQKKRLYERRRFQRVNINLLGRFMLENKREYPCQVINMSPGDAAIIAPVGGKLNEKVIAYVDHIGRIEGKIARQFDGGFAVLLNATSHKREKLAAQLTWLANRDILNLPEDRRHDRQEPKISSSRMTLSDGRQYTCRVIDVSLSGAAVSMAVKPAIGTPITLGKMRARIVRHLPDGVAVEFSSIQPMEVIESHLS
ncbi:PilZ domain-containing protein [Coralliovum pocilloporae]|uniref:PilZ domain-containing protein n=1 Tax=Coralliovum pocilloporae TaxID=3066369 RepID=UPI00330710E9